MKSPKRPISSSMPLDAWEITPSVDFITLSMSRLKRDELRKALIKDGKASSAQIEVPKPTDITIHDPRIEQLQFMIDQCPNAVVEKIELTLDFRPQGSVAADLDELAPLFRWLSDCVLPPMQKARQKYYDDSGQYLPMSKMSSANLTTRLWEDSRQWTKQRLYIKTQDHGQQVKRPSVRLEVTLNRGSCQDIGVSRLWQLCEVAPDIRRKFAPYFWVARGIKPKKKRLDRLQPGTSAAQEAERFTLRELRKVDRAWRYYGAMWAVKNSYLSMPDQNAVRRIGNALARLRADFMALKLPKNSCGEEVAKQVETRVVLVRDDWQTITSIGTQPYYN